MSLKAVPSSLSLRDMVELCKLRVVALMVLTAIIAMFLATPNGFIPWQALVFGSLGISMASCSGGVLNQILDRRIDAVMARTQGRPIPSGRIALKQAIVFAALLAVVGTLLLLIFVNPMVAVLSFLSLIAYGGVYTVFLKRSTSQNIVIGGLAGAMPPLLGWSAVTGQINCAALLLVLIIYTWTPPHFWALAIHRKEEYAKANIPMLPVTHGIAYTKLSIVLYTILMIISTYLPFAIGLSGWIYLVSVMILNVGFLYYVIRLYLGKDNRFALPTFHYSILYLTVLFTVLLLDHLIAV